MASFDGDSVSFEFPMNFSSQLLPVPRMRCGATTLGPCRILPCSQGQRPVPRAKSPPLRNRKDTAKPAHVKARDLSLIVLPGRYFVETPGLHAGDFCGRNEALPDAFLTHPGDTFRTWTDDGDCGLRRGWQFCWPSGWFWPRSSPDPARPRPDPRPQAPPRVPPLPVLPPPPSLPRQPLPHRPRRQSRSFRRHP